MKKILIIVFLISNISLILANGKIIDKNIIDSTINKNNVEQFQHINNFNIEPDLKNNSILLKWKKDSNITNYYVFRSQYKNNHYNLISTVSGNTFTDKKIIKGYEYWYIVISENININTIDNTQNYYFSKNMHIKPENLKSHNLKYLLQNNNKKISNKAIKNNVLYNKYFNILKKYYYNKVKLNILFLMADSFIKSGELVVHRLQDDNYFLNYRKRVLVISDPNENYIIKFYSKRLFKMFIETNKDKLLSDRLIKNSILFCLLAKEKKIKDKHGNIRYIPVYEAVGMPTHFFKYDKDWEKNTLMFGTSTKKLNKRMKRIQREYNKRLNDPATIH